jgi:L-alanine-DL-glutamate epimerase-like enolase superfamily enzyme
VHEPYERHTEVVAAVRKALGPDIVLMVDVQYMWPDAATALATVREWKPYDLFFLETPIWVDRLDEYAKLHDQAPMKIALGEWQATHWEFEDVMDRGKVDVVQPDVGRVGGLLEAKAVCDMAAARGRIVVPHCWKTAVSIAATAHLAFTAPHCAFIEFLPPELCLETLRKELATTEMQIVDGKIARPRKPGLGVELDMDALKRYAVA